MRLGSAGGCFPDMTAYGPLDTVVKLACDGADTNTGFTATSTTAGTSLLTYNNDLFGRPRGTVYLYTGYLTSSATIPALPSGNAARSVSFWMNAITPRAVRCIVEWGPETTNQRFGVCLNTDGCLYITGHSNDFAVGVSAVSDSISGTSWMNAINTRTRGSWLHTTSELPT